MEAICDGVQWSASITSGWVPGEGDRGASGTSNDLKVAGSRGGLLNRGKEDGESRITDFGIA